MTFFDFHTHNLQAIPGTAIVNLPEEFLRTPEKFKPEPQALYSIGLHPWWTNLPDSTTLLLGVEKLLPHTQVVALGECGFDRLRGATIVKPIIDFPTSFTACTTQNDFFLYQVMLSERFAKPLTLHCVRCFDLLLYYRKHLHPTQVWTIHCFRGGPRLAQQLLDAGFDLSFGRHYHAESYKLTPPERRHVESDDDRLPDFCI